MGVTLSTAAERRRRQAPAGVPGLGPAPRDRETLLLAGALVVLLLGLVLVYKAVTHPFAEAQAAIARGDIVDLQTLRQPEQLLPLLAFLDEPAERTFVARRIFRRLQEGPVPNAGELAKIRVPLSEIADASSLPVLSRRAEGVQAPTISLLTYAQLRELKPHVVVRSPGTFKSRFWLWALLLLAGFLVLHVVWRVKRYPGDELLLPIVFILSGLGLLLMASIRDPLRDTLLFRTFAQGVLAGCALLLAGSFLDVERSPLRRTTFAPLGLAVLLSILLILFGSGPGGSDAKVNLFGFQPVEAVKILVVLFLAGYFFDRWELLRELTERRAGLSVLRRWVQVPKIEYAATPIAAIGLVLVFFFLQKDLGPALVLSFLFLILWTVARGRGLMLAVGAALVASAFWIGYKLNIPRTVSGRLAMWVSPWDNSFRGGDHLAQSLWAMATGSLTGTGLGLGQPGVVPEVHTDMVLAAVGEELGFVGVLTILALYVVLIWRGFRAAYRASGLYSFFLALGLTLLLALQMLLIAGGVLGVFPLSGVVSPFLSSGRSAMLANFLIVGLLLAISARPGDGSAARRFHGAVRWVAVGLSVLAVGIVLKAAFVQVVRPNNYLVRGALTLQADGWRRFQYNPRLAEIADTIPRGSILDRNGIPLATSEPKELDRHRATYERLGSSLERISGRPGTRLYPFGGKTFHLLGDLRNRVNWAASNTSYAERDSRIRLQGWDDYAAVVEVRQPTGEMSELVQVDYSELIPLMRHRHQPEHPDVQKVLKRDRNLRMSIDIRLQLRAAAILERYAEQSGHGAAAVVLDAGTGDLLASVSYPWPERLPVKASEDPKEGVIDRARYGIYPPGSTFKLVTAMAALRKDPALASQVFECVPLPDGRVGNRVRGFGKPIRDDPNVHAAHGRVDLEKGIRVSCNAYFAQLGTLEVGPEPLLETAKLFGISVAQPNSAEQLAKSLPQSSYGQGQVTATPFQMARVAATVANGGRMPQGRWVIDDSNERKAEPIDVLTGPPIRLIARSMRGVVTTGTAAALAGIQPPVAGKTGTAEVQDKRSHSWFVAFAPFGASTEGQPPGRKIAVGVIVEHGGYGGRLAVPAAGEIIRAAADLGLIQ